MSTQQQEQLESFFYIKGFEGFSKGRKSGLKITERTVNNSRLINFPIEIKAKIRYLIVYCYKVKLR